MAASGFHIRGAYLSWSVWKGSEKVSRDYTHLDNAHEALTRLERQQRQRQRPCICCGTDFLSEGAHNRMCTRCRDRASEAA